jgi:cytochrome c553
MRFLKVIGRVLLVFVAAVFVIGLVLGFLGGRKADERHEIPGSVLLSSAPDDAAAIARGAHWASILGCRDCHGEDLQGKVMVDVPPFRAAPSNLTPGAGGVGASYKAADWDRAVRYGVKPDGRAVFFMMPSTLYHGLADGDMADLAAFLSSLAPVDHELPPSELRMPGKIIAGAGGLDPAVEVSSADRAREPAPPLASRGATAEFGRYLASITCVECHGQELAGGRHPDPAGPPAPSLEAAAGWSADEFRLAATLGVAPGGCPGDPEWMPWPAFQHMTADEVEALRSHVKTVFR